MDLQVELGGGGESETLWQRMEVTATEQRSLAAYLHRTNTVGLTRWKIVPLTMLVLATNLLAIAFL